MITDSFDNRSEAKINLFIKNCLKGDGLLCVFSTARIAGRKR